MVRYDFSALSDDEFEELCKSIMRRKGFTNVQRLSGPGSGDMGRDITADENLTSLTQTTIPTRILVQCKNYAGSRTSIGPAVVEALANRARTLECNRVLIITSYDLTSAAKTVASQMVQNPAWRILAEWWNEFDLNGFLAQYPDIVRQYELSISPQLGLNIGILDGYAKDRVNEKQCVPTFSRVSAKDWNTLLAGNDVTISYISSNEIDSSFDAIVNPFGETYPEENHESNTTYLRILNYISDGGVFVNVAGFPFFYYWKSREGRNETVIRPSYVYIPATNQIVGFNNFNDTLLYNDFQIALDERSPTSVEISQTNADKQCVGNLMNLNIQRVHQFRSVIPGNANIVPFIRAESNSIYPMAAVKHGNGSLVIAGFDLYVEEAPLIAKALKNWLKSGGGEFPLPEEARAT